jgi:3-methylcrotonyl-CoA carboxylase beta subunit
MCGRAYSPEFLYSWPMSKISVMGGSQAANVMTTIKRNLSEQEKEVYFNQMKAKYETEAEALFATARLWDDGIILPEQTRDVLGLSLLVAKNNHPEFEIGSPGNFGVFRM